MIEKIVEEIIKQGGDPYFVGGYVRDALMGVECDDIDVEVFNMSMLMLEFILAGFGKVDAVGKEFGVLKFKDGKDDYDFAIPRRENRIGASHTDFDTECDPSMTIEEASSRRDYTINSIYKDFDGIYYDPNCGRTHLSTRELHPVSNKFLEDPLRILRGMQFAARFKMHATESTKDFGEELVPEFDSISKDRVWHEWYKWATLCASPSCGLRFLQDCEWLSLFPELNRLEFTSQDPEWHPEGNVWTHTKFVCNAANRQCEQFDITGEDKAVIMFAALLHDIGKPDTTIQEDGRIRSPNHANVGVPIAEQFLHSINCPHYLIDRILPLVKYHMVLIGVDPTPKFVRRMVVKLGKAEMSDLIILMQADKEGRPPLDPTPSLNLIKMMNIYEKLMEDGTIENGKIKPIVQGRDLIELGVKSGPNIGAVLKELFSLQLNGEFFTLEDGIKKAKELI